MHNQQAETISNCDHCRDKKELILTTAHKVDSLGNHEKSKSACVLYSLQWKNIVWVQSLYLIQDNKKINLEVQDGSVKFTQLIRRMIWRK